MKSYSIFGLLKFTLGVAALLAALTLNYQATSRLVKLKVLIALKQPNARNLRQDHAANQNALKRRIRSYETAFEGELGIPMTSTRFRLDIDDPNADPADFFSDPKAQDLCRLISDLNRNPVTALVDYAEGKQSPSKQPTEDLRKLLEQGVNVNHCGDGNVTPLLWAMSVGNKQAFKLLLDYGADPNIIYSDDLPIRNQVALTGQSVAETALWNSDPTYFKWVVKLIDEPTRKLMSGDNWLIRYLRSRTRNLYSPDLHIVQTLIDKGIDVDAVSPRDGKSACYIARFSPKTCSLLISNGANPFASNPNDAEDILELTKTALDRNHFAGPFNNLTTVTAADLKALHKQLVERKKHTVKDTKIDNTKESIQVRQ